MKTNRFISLLAHEAIVQANIANHFLAQLVRLQMLDKSKLVRVLSRALVTVEAQRQALLVGGALQEAEAGEVANWRQGSG